MEIEKKQCHVLCAGGGIAGLMAAIRAAEKGAKVIVAEKGNTLHSGCGGMGNDHFQCYIPEVHGDFDVFARELSYGQMGGVIGAMDRAEWQYWFRNSYDIVKLWDSWGIPMKYQGRWEFAGHGFPGHQLNHLKYEGEMQKPVLTRQALERGAEIINRVMVFDLLLDNRGDLVGAIGVSTREPKIYVFEAKSVILGTGRVTRLWPGVTPGYDFNRAHIPAVTGDGRMMAYRAGAPLVNIEMSGRHAGPKYFARAGQATWVGVLRDRNGNAIGPFVNAPDKLYGDITTEVNKIIFEEYMQSGRGPVYMDMNGISDEDLEYMVHWLLHEGNAGLINHLAEEGVDLKKAAIEFQTFEMALQGGVRFDEKAETQLKGLYAAGDEFCAGISWAATLGWAAGENAASYAETAGTASVDGLDNAIRGKIALLEEIRNRQDGIPWQDANYALQQLMKDYCGNTRSRTLLSAGLDNIRRLRKKARNLMMAENPHELMHCLEVLNLLDIGELVIIAAEDRKETRGLHRRSDFALTNPIFNDKRHIIKQVNRSPVTEWERIKR